VETPAEYPNLDASVWKFASLGGGGIGDEQFLLRLLNCTPAAEPSGNPCLSDNGDAAGRVDSNGGLVPRSAPNCAPVSGSDTRRLFPTPGSAPRLGRRMLPVVLTAHVPVDANGIEFDFRGVLDGVLSGDTVGSSIVVWVGSNPA
jgi:hypothetical protein